MRAGLCRLSRRRELTLYGVLRSSPPGVATWHTKIVHLGEAPSTSCLLAWWRSATLGGADHPAPLGSVRIPSGKEEVGYMNKTRPRPAIPISGLILGLDLTRVTAPSRTDRRVLLAVVAGLLMGCLLLLFLHEKPASAAVTPPDFTDTRVTSVDSPTALAFTPDGRMLVTSEPGRLWVYKDGALLANPALDISGKVCTNGARGLLGVAVDPNFATNHYIYLFYTFKKHGVCPQNTANVPVNRVERYVLSDSNTATPDKILLDNIPNMHHNNAGDLRFGKDGYLYVTVGDGACDYAGDSGCGGENDASRDPHILLGKVLRITRDGGIPTTNPYTGTDSARC